MGRKVMSPAGGENATPKPHSSAPMGGKAGSGRMVKSSGDVMAGRPRYSSPTPDMKGRLFSHKADKPGV